jgi:hypothetical protein
MGRGADWVMERGAFRVEQHGSTFEVMERRGGYRLSLLSKRDRDNLRALLDRMDRIESPAPILALGERRKA